MYSALFIFHKTKFQFTCYTVAAHVLWDTVLKKEYIHTENIRDKRDEIIS